MSASSFVHDLSSIGADARSALSRSPSFFIDGEWVRASGTLPVFDPSSGDQVAEIGAGGAAEVDAAVAAARRALRDPAWAKIGPLAREGMIRRLAALIEENAQALAEVETVDNGMPAWFALGPTMFGAAGVYGYYAGWPSKITGEMMPVEGPPGMGEFVGYTRREPVGVVGAIVPWNVPFMMAAWKVAPALAAGCTVVLKPAEDTSLSALMLADLVARAGFPRGVVNIVTGRGAEAGEALVNHPGVDKITFTGSTAVGRRIAETAGRNLKKHTVELGGKSPTILFGDADLDKAIPGAALSTIINSGQICVAGSRLYVQSSVYDRVVEGIGAFVKTLRIGAGLAPDVFLGPLVNAAQKQRVAGYIEAAGVAGAEVLRGESVEGAAGHFVSPAVVTGATDDAAITREEVFGPVLSIYRFDDEDEAVARANASEYGLSSTIWSNDYARVNRVAAALDAGKVLVNNAGFPYPGLGEGGRKASGYGRDLGREGIEGCLQSKTIIAAV